MRHGKGMLIWALTGMLIASAGVALAAETATAPATGKATASEKKMAKAATHRTVRGEVTAIQSDSLTVKLQGKGDQLFKASLTDKTLVREGKAKKSVSDLKAGERVAIRYNYDQANQANMADSVRILREAPKAQG